MGKVTDQENAQLFQQRSVSQEGRSPSKIEVVGEKPSQDRRCEQMVVLILQLSARQLLSSKESHTFTSLGKVFEYQVRMTVDRNGVFENMTNGRVPLPHQR